MNQTLNIVYNVDAISHPLTGIGRYTQQLGLALQQQASVNDIRLFSGGRWLTDFTSINQQNQWLANMRRYVPFKRLALNAYHAKRCRALRAKQDSLKAYVLHSPNFILMPFDGPAVTTIHDLSYVHHRQTQPDYRLRFMDREIPKTLDQAAQIITVSQAVKDEITATYGLPEERICVTPLGVDEQFQPLPAIDCQAVLQTYNLKHKHYLLAVATREPRKNLWRLIQAYGQLPTSVRAHFPLVLVGDRGWLNKELNHVIKQHQIHIRLTGYVEQTDLHRLYAAATMTLMPSLYEGFGLPIIESMACGTPVLTSDVGAMKEVSGGHALLCQPLDIDDMKDKLLWAIDNPEWRQHASVSGLNHSRRFSWQNCASETIRAYEKAIKAYTA